MALVGCGGEEPAGWLGQGIVNGETDQQHLAVGMIYTSDRGYCTATVIGARTVLTAAHCLEQMSAPDVVFELDHHSYAVEEIDWHAGYTKTGTFAELPDLHPGIKYLDDIGLVRLKHQVRGVKPVPLATEPPGEEQAITLVGYGQASAGDYGWPRQRRSTETRVAFVGAGYFLYGNCEGMNGSRGNTGPGDSGGPTLLWRGGEEVLVGIHSKGANAHCGWGYDMEVSHFRDWIRQHTGWDLGQRADQTPPSIALSTSGAADDAGTPRRFRIEADDGQSGLHSLTLHLDGELIGESRVSPWTVTLPDLEVGQHELEIVATDREENRERRLHRFEVAPLEEPQPGGCRAVPGTATGVPWAIALLLVMTAVLRRRR